MKEETEKKLNDILGRVDDQRKFAEEAQHTATYEERRLVYMGQSIVLDGIYKLLKQEFDWIKKTRKTNPRKTTAEEELKKLSEIIRARKRQANKAAISAQTPALDAQYVGKFLAFSEVYALLQKELELITQQSE